MRELNIYCIAVDDRLVNRIKEINCIPVGLGNTITSDGWKRDNISNNISDKNKYYGELTFYYWLWKNELNDLPDNTWLGFSQYRRHWSSSSVKSKNINNLDSNILKKVPIEWSDYETILPEPMDLTHLKFMKLLKYGKIALLNNPMALFKKKKRNIKFNFDMMHGNGLLDKAIELLNDEDKEDFKNYTLKETALCPANMFICKSKKKIDAFYSTLFSWLEKCEKTFGFDLEGYRKTRIYAFLSERFLPYWFKKNSNFLEWPIIFYDLRDDLKIQEKYEK
tara:strand:+ start:3961 stop:4797 length:837 start_codon:yes stop_codon:yes gene_type:complete